MDRHTHMHTHKIYSPSAQGSPGEPACPLAGPSPAAFSYCDFLSSLHLSILFLCSQPCCSRCVGFSHSPSLLCCLSALSLSLPFLFSLFLSHSASVSIFLSLSSPLSYFLGLSICPVSALLGSAIPLPHCHLPRELCLVQGDRRDGKEKRGFE